MDGGDAETHVCIGRKGTVISPYVASLFLSISRILKVSIFSMTSFLLVSLLFFVIWIAFLLFSEETRHEQLVMSAIGLVLSPAVLIMAVTDFRAIATEPAAIIGVEDLIFAFSFFGIAAVIYQVLIGKHAHKIRGPKYEVHHAGHWFAHIILVLGLIAVTSLLLIYVFDLSSVKAFAIGALLIGMYVVADRHDLLMNALVSGIFMASLLFLLEQLFFVRLFPVEAGQFWQFDQLSPLLLGGVPMEELMWAAIAGFTVGPLYEWSRHLRLQNS